MFAMYPHRFEHLVITNARDHIEGIGAAFKQRHRLEARSPGTVVPQQRNDRQLVFRRGFHVHAANAQTTVTRNDDDLLARPAKLHADAHAYAVPHWRQRTGINYLPREVGGEPLAGVTAQREAVDDE